MSPLRVGLWARWLTVYALVTAALSRISGLPDIRTSHAILSYFVLVILASREGGRALSMTMVVLSYVAVDWYFVPPRRVFGAANDLDWFVLLGFLVTGWLLSELFAKQREATRIAEERTREVERLSRERLQLEREASTAQVLREADRLKNALLHSVAHDLRSPVATLSLLADPAAGFPTDVALQRVGEEADRLGEFLATLQRFATEGGGNLLDTAPQVVDHVCQTALRSSEGMLAGRLVRLDLPATPPTVRCDLTLSVQVLGNLLQNAVRYAPPQAPIDLIVRSADAMVDIIVADRGPGVTAVELQQLFTPLSRTRSDGGPASPAGASNDRGQRMGMGLAIARTFARAQRGDVLYRARAGGGAEFVLRLPHASVV